jgi:hypothetical protein
MTLQVKNLDRLIENLEERVKELSCLFELEEMLHQPEITTEEIFQRLVEIIPQAWRYPDVCLVKIVFNDDIYASSEFEDSPWALNSDIIVQENVIGTIRVCYREEMPASQVGPFLVEEKKLLDSIAQRVSSFVMYQKLKQVFDRWENTKQTISEKKQGEWRVIIELIRRTDLDLYIKISRKMLNHLAWKGIEGAEELLQQFSPEAGYKSADVSGESNTPLAKKAISDSFLLSKKIFRLAEKNIKNTRLLSLIQHWMQQDKSAFLVRAVSSGNTTMNEIGDAIRRYYQLTPEGMELIPSVRLGVRAALIRRIFSDQLEFITIAKHFIRVTDFRRLLSKIIFPKESHGKLGGKSAGVILAHRILKKSTKHKKLLRDIKIPNSWFLSSDVMITFMHYNNLEEILEQKYKDIEEVKTEYPHVVLLFKNSHFPPDIIQGLSMALDDFGEKPLVVRSSSLLEDRLGSAFAGKYKSLFLANQGTKRNRLNALMDAIAEIYASTIGPDPIGYRAERGLLDFHEEMGIIIQEVVGRQVGDYFLPSYAGVAFSNNEFRWSPRIKKEDGLVRMVPGLGTRAVDRVSDDYPILIAPGQPGLRASSSIEEIIRYSPQKVDVINLKTNSFETLEISKLIKEAGDEYPALDHLVSVYQDKNLRSPGLHVDYSNLDLIVTFDGLINNTSFVKQIRTIIKELEAAMNAPVDIEFACDGEDFYLLQCRPQSYSKYTAPAKIPSHIPANKYIFSANKYISNGTVSNIKYIVYVPPEAYSAIKSLEELQAIGKVVGKLNKILPHQRFILMGPGRWGSRGDIKLGVNVTYSDINNAAMLIEVGRKKSNYTPDLSFGTHFFQDLVEANIRYLPLYPDEPEIIFNNDILLKSENRLPEYLQEFEGLKDYVRLIDIERSFDGQLLQVLMNGDAGRAAGILAPPITPKAESEVMGEQLEATVADHWRWRFQVAEKMASTLDKKRFGVEGIYLIGSTQELNAGVSSDIDIFVHFSGNKAQQKELLAWFDGWSLCLDEWNLSQTKHKIVGILDIKLMEDSKVQELGGVAKAVKSLHFDTFKELIAKN